MAYELEKRLVVGVASSALFNLEESDRVFREEGEEEYRAYQEAHLDDTLRPGVAFSFIRRLLGLNDLSSNSADPLVEVIVLSRNDPDTGLRVMRSIEAHGLPISRAAFTQGVSPHEYIPAFSMSLFLSANEADVQEAVLKGFPAGQVLGATASEDDGGSDLRIAFDFDGVLASDAAERVFQSGGLSEFHVHESELVATPLDPGPLRELLEKLNQIQEADELRRGEVARRAPRIRVSIVTARNAPAHERAIASLKAWGVKVNDAFFMGGIDKARVLQILKPHLYFDDQIGHLTGILGHTSSVHIPFGVTNDPAPAKPSV